MVKIKLWLKEWRLLLEKWEDAVKAINKSHKDTIFDAQIGWLLFLYYYFRKIFYCNGLFMGNILLFWYIQTMYNNQIAVLGISVCSNINSFYVCGILYLLWGKIDCSHWYLPYCTVEARTSFLPMPGQMWTQVGLGTCNCSPSAVAWKVTSPHPCVVAGRTDATRSIVSIFDILWRR